MIRFLLVTCLLLLPIALVAGPVDNTGLTVPTPQSTASRSITEYTDQAAWEAAAAAAITVNPYGDLGVGVIVTDQYLALGALYTDADDQTYPYSESIDGMLLNGNGRIHVTLSSPAMAVAVNYPGAVAIIGYLGGAEIFSSSDFGSSGSGLFAGIVSTEPFDSLEIYDWVDDAVYIDDLDYTTTAVPTEAQAWSQVKSLFR